MIMDVDGVVSPVGGLGTAWGDDVVAGDVFGPVLVSPTLCARLDALSQVPGVSCVWLTSWSAAMRASLHPFPGRDWQVVADATGARSPERDWWKFDALEAWLDWHPEVRALAWCDDHLAGGRLPAVRRGLRAREVRPLLLAPRTEVGLTPAHMGRLDAWVGTQLG